MHLHHTGTGESGVGERSTSVCPASARAWVVAAAGRMGVEDVGSGSGGVVGSRLVVAALALVFVSLVGCAQAETADEDVLADTSTADVGVPDLTEDDTGGADGSNTAPGDVTSDSSDLVDGTDADASTGDADSSPDALVDGEMDFMLDMDTGMDMSATCDPACGTHRECVDGTCVCAAEGTVCGASSACCAEGCTDPLVDPLNCGGCGVACPVGVNAPTALCAAGACSLACLAGFGDCDGDLTTGCETRLDVALNCGACGNTCGPDQTCVNGTCECTGGSCMCQAGEAFCDGACVSTASADAHCGGCGNACGNDASCASGACVCDPGFTACGGGCVPNGDVCTPQTIETEMQQGCGACGNGSQTRERTCQASCTWGAWTAWGACMDDDCCGNGVCEATESCTNCGDCQAGHLGTGSNDDPCPGVPAEQWRCVFDPNWGTNASQVCRNGKWVNSNLDPSNCAACVCGFSSACTQ